MISFPCRSCSQLIRVAETLAGTVTVCPQCQSQVPVPLADVESRRAGRISMSADPSGARAIGSESRSNPPNPWTVSGTGSRTSEDSSTPSQLAASLSSGDGSRSEPAALDPATDATLTFGRVTESTDSLARVDPDRPGSPLISVASGAANSDSHALADPAAPLTLGSYRLLRLLGEGGMGKVYLARHLKLDKLVALKVLPESRLNQPGLVQRFEREMKAVGRLDHPHIVRALDAGEALGSHYLVMEYVDGIDLSQVVQRLGPLALADACELIRQAAVGLQEAADAQMVHRDLKPSNLMLVRPASRRAAPLVKILDLGLALLAEPGESSARDITETGQVMGTVDYMAPEQGNDSHQVDIRADIYSLGATLCKLLTGRAPFEDPRFDSLMKKLTALAIEPIPDLAQRRPELPPELIQIVERMLARRPDDRFTAPMDVATALEPFCAAANLRVVLKQALGEPLTDDDRSPPTARINPANPSAVTDRVGLMASGLSSAVTQPTAALESQTAVLAGQHGVAGSGARSGGGGRRWLRGVLGLVAAGAFGLAAWAVIVFWTTRFGVIRIETNDPEIVVEVTEQGALIRKHGNESFQLTPGEKVFQIRHGDATFSTRQMEIQRGTSTLKVELLDQRLSAELNGQLIGEQRVGRDERPSSGASGSAAGTESIARLAEPIWNELGLGPGSGKPLPVVSPLDPQAAARLQLEWAESLGLPPTYTNSLGMQFRLIPPGQFVLGCSNSEIDQLIAQYFRGVAASELESLTSEAPPVLTLITRPFYLGLHEVRQSDFEQLLGRNPAWHAATGSGREAIADLDTATFPVEQVRWSDCVEFCGALSAQEGHASAYDGSATYPQLVPNPVGYRLPTEAEWEYAARAGTSTRYWFGDEINPGETAEWLQQNAAGRTHAVATAQPNPFGLYDLQGNVNEWVQDGWDPAFRTSFTKQPAVDPLAPRVNEHGVVRRGDFVNPEILGRASGRQHQVDPSAFGNVGFRVALSVEAVRHAIVTASIDQSLSVPGPAEDDPMPQPQSSTDSVKPMSSPAAVEEATTVSLHGGLRFAGEGQYVEDAAVLINLQRPWTMECWVTPDEQAFGRESLRFLMVTSQSSLALSNPWKDEIRWQVTLLLDETTQVLQSDTVVRFGQRVHLAVVYDGMTVRLFVDGQQQQMTASGAFASGDHKLTSLPSYFSAVSLDSPTKGFYGVIDAAHVTLSAKYQGNFTPADEIVADEGTEILLPLDDGQGEIVHDRSGHGHDGTLVGARWVRKGPASPAP